ncbi:hypothetical protein [Streptococcus sp. zg-JUN1979]|uniref:hypothetical protein n=1 Tax=Streptococcus sp. zg-JUN1979 TaxID=3391450 RepID=UPI0039A69EB4
MEDWEKKAYLDKAQKEQEKQTKLYQQSLDNQRYQQDQLRRDNERYQEEQRLERYEKEMRDKIDKLKLELAKAQDPVEQLNIQELLEEAKQEQAQYFEEKAERERLAREAEKERRAAMLIAQKEEEERLAAEQKEAKVKRIWRIFWGVLLSLLTAVLLFLVWGFFLSSDDKREEATSQFASSSTSKSTTKTSSSSSSSSSKSSSTHSSSQSDTAVSSEIQEVPVYYAVRVKIKDLHIRSNPYVRDETSPYITPGVYTIVGTVSADGYTWGRLASGEGWIALEYTEPADASTSSDVNTKDLTVDQVKNWVTHAIDAQGYSVDDISNITVKTGSDRLVYATVTMASDSGSRQIEYRISSRGYLEQKFSDTWYVQSREYEE